MAQESTSPKRLSRNRNNSIEDAVPDSKNDQPNHVSSGMLSLLESPLACFTPNQRISIPMLEHLGIKCINFRADQW